MNIIDCHAYDFANNGIYASNCGKKSGGGGKVHVRGGLYKNNNISGIRIGSPGSSIKNVVVTYVKFRAGSGEPARNK